MLEAKDIISQRIDCTHYYNVVSARKKLGLKLSEDYVPNNGIIENHSLKDRTLYDKEKNRLIHIQDVYKHWYGGYYLTLLYYTWSDGYSELGYRSHGTMFWENINSINDIVLKSIEENRKNHILL